MKGNEASQNEKKRHIEISHNLSNHIVMVLTLNMKLTWASEGARQ